MCVNAALEHPRVKTAYLIDPVDNDKRFAPESEDNPSAVKALAASGQTLGIVGEIAGNGAEFRPTAHQRPPQ